MTINPSRGVGANTALGADDDLHVSLGNPLPLPVPLDVAQMAVQHGHRIKPRAEAADRLRREADFGHEHDRLPSVPDGFADGLNVDLGFAAAGDAVQHERRMPPVAQRVDDLANAAALVGVERQIGFARDGCEQFFADVAAFVRSLNDAFLPQRLDRRRTAADRVGDFRRREGFGALQQEIEDGFLLRGIDVRRPSKAVATFVGRPSKAVALRVFRTDGPGRPSYGVFRGDAEDRELPRAGFPLHPRRHDRLQHLSPTAQVIVGDPAGELQHRGRKQRLSVEDGIDRLQSPVPRDFRKTLETGRPDRDAEPVRRTVPLPERRPHPHPRFEHLAECIGNQIMKLRVQRPVEHDLSRPPIRLRRPFPRRGPGFRELLGEQALLAG